MQIIVGFGNSLTYGYLVNRGYLDILGDFINKENYKIVNSGIPGDTVIDGFQRLEYSVLKHNPYITIFEFALNDAFSNISVPKFREYYLNMLNRVDNLKFIMIPHLPGEKFLEKQAKPYYHSLKLLAEETDIPIIDISKHKFSEKELLLDNVHPNEKGYRIYAEEVYKALKGFLNES